MEVLGPCGSRRTGALFGDISAFRGPAGPGGPGGSRGRVVPVSPGGLKVLEPGSWGPGGQACLRPHWIMGRVLLRLGCKNKLFTCQTWRQDRDRHTQDVGDLKPWTVGSASPAPTVGSACVLLICSDNDQSEPGWITVCLERASLPQ